MTFDPPTPLSDEERRHLLNRLDRNSSAWALFQLFVDMEIRIMGTLASAISTLQTNDAALDQTIAQAVTQLQSGGATASQIAAVSAVAADLGTQNQTLQSALASAGGTPAAPTVAGGAGMDTVAGT